MKRSDSVEAVPSKDWNGGAAKLGGSEIPF